MDWTTKQDEVLRDHCTEGAAAVRDAIERECGVSRTVHAVEAHASRMGVSLAVRPECPECHAVGVRINKVSGMCARCTARARVAEEKAFNDLLALEAAGCDEGPEIDAARREYARLRKAGQRIRKAAGLASKRERDCNGVPI